MSGRGRTVALVALLAGAVGSMFLMRRVGPDAPRFLLLTFAVWVLAPFLALAAAEMFSTQWPSRSRAALHGLSIAVAVISVAVYGTVAFGPRGSQPAFWFMVVPAGSLLLIAAAVVFARRSPRAR